ncbi:MAG: polymer-forming cytoskeletal protein [Desulfosarcinaceae bacterium]
MIDEKKGDQMFGLKRNKPDEDENIIFMQGTSSENVPDPTKQPVEKVDKTVIGKHIVIEGNVRGDENLLIEGSMKGTIDIPKHDFHLGVEGRFEGEIHALNVTIGGEMKGDIKTMERVVITKDADVQGDIKTKTISFEDGAYFKGSIELDKNNHKKSTAVNKTSGTVPQAKIVTEHITPNGEHPEKTTAASKKLETQDRQLDSEKTSKPKVQDKKLNKN